MQPIVRFTEENVFVDTFFRIKLKRFGFSDKLFTTLNIPVSVPHWKNIFDK